MNNKLKLTINNKELAVVHILEKVLESYKGGNTFLIKLKSEIGRYTLMCFIINPKNYSEVVYFAVGLYQEIAEELENILKTDEDIIKFCNRLLDMMPSNPNTKISSDIIKLCKKILSFVSDTFPSKINYEAIKKDAKMLNLITILDKKLSTLG